LIPPGSESNGNGPLGKLNNALKENSQVEPCSDVNRMVELMFNYMNYGLGITLLSVCGFQVAMIMYLFCMGPIAAAFYAWPNGVGNLFNKVFANWVDAVINVSLWRVWWMVVLLIVQTRIQWLGASYNPASQWEMMMMAATNVILVYVPFTPFEFQPGGLVEHVITKAREASSQAINKVASQGGGGGGGGEGGGGNSGGGNAREGGFKSRHHIVHTLGR
jgi:hypothetical protein